MKICTVCNKEKQLKSFRRDKNQKDGYQSRCKLCASQRIRSAYIQKYSTIVNKRNKSRHEERKKQIYKYKSEHPCERCGEMDPRCLDFHHKDKAQKSFGVSGNHQRNWNKILEEIKKCEVLCANCHRKEHGE